MTLELSLDVMVNMFFYWKVVMKVSFPNLEYDTVTFYYKVTDEKSFLIKKRDFSVVEVKGNDSCYVYPEPMDISSGSFIVIKMDNNNNCSIEINIKNEYTFKLFSDILVSSIHKLQFESNETDNVCEITIHGRNKHITAKSSFKYNVIFPNIK